MTRTPSTSQPYMFPDLALPEDEAGQGGYRTPPWILERLQADFGRFTFDLAASEQNAITVMYAKGPCEAPAECFCGLHIPLWNHSIFCNPPFSQMRLWAPRWAELTGVGTGNTVLALHHWDHTTKWWRSIVDRGANELLPIPKRVSYIHPGACTCKSCANNEPPAGDRNPSVVSVWLPGRPPDHPVVNWHYWD